MKFTNLSAAERAEIGILWSKGYSIRSIAKSLERSPNTVHYELRRNKTKRRYDPKKADAKSRLRKRMRRLQWMKIEEVPELRRLHRRAQEEMEPRRNIGQDEIGGKTMVCFQELHLPMAVLEPRSEILPASVFKAIP